MRKSGGGFGIIMLAVVVVIVLLLVARAWSEMAPQALQVTNTLEQIDDSAGDEVEGETHPPGHLPDLNDMRRETREHDKQVQETLDAIN